MTDTQPAAGIEIGLARIAGWLDGERVGAEVTVRGVSTDSRRVQPGNLFVALRGPNHDAHRFVADAAAAGAAAVLVAERQAVDLPQVIVRDTRLALGRLGAAWRNHCGTVTIAITGSNGKTTVKEMVAAVLARQAPTLATRGNLNNDIGVPLTLLGLTPRHRYAVVEMGANHAGEIAYLTSLVRPRVAVITNAGPAHLEGFGSIEGVAHAKGEIFSGLEEEGTAVINADDRFEALWQELAAGYRIVRFGTGSEADVSGGWRLGEDGLELDISHGERRFTVPLSLLGAHNALNALAATAVLRAVGIEPEAIVAGLADVKPVPGRLQLRRHGAVRVIDDSYNANPASVTAALRVLLEFPGPRYLVLGDMGELGPDSDALHRQVGAEARALGIDGVLTLGPSAALAAAAFGNGAEAFEDLAPLLEQLARVAGDGATVLIKGSRAARMERVVTALLEAKG